MTQVFKLHCLVQLHFLYFRSLSCLLFSLVQHEMRMCPIPWTSPWNRCTNWLCIYWFEFWLKHKGLTKSSKKVNDIVTPRYRIKWYSIVHGPRLPSKTLKSICLKSFLQEICVEQQVIIKIIKPWTIPCIAWIQSCDYHCTRCFPNVQRLN